MLKRMMVAGIALALVACDDPSPEAEGSATIPPRESAPARSVSREDDGGMAPSDASPKTRVRPQVERKSVEMVDGRPGFARSPYTGEEIDIRGLLPGSVIDDPSFAEGSGKQIRIPEDAAAVARPLPGKPGYVFSPYNNQVIDVKGVPPGTLVADPMYPPEEKKYFRVPEFPEEEEEAPEE